ncbi:ABC transporter ATP-binding protein [Microbacterium sp. SD291]|uniref:ABC transporter ATP-binding protein n=1 Tax=Microbacterium sp. SD291 TaxID=2782007 RepID=UPI001A959975|nr:ABC transporter ATP-binding protein [Microbacterium sp. SD291]MBO0980081.1 ABC transporter ATP-binding protein [Microbacterium sp. SD291]
MAIIELKDVVKAFPLPHGGSKIAVDGISLAVEQGECLGIIGESGSGKSTLGRLILRLYEADSGTVLLDGRDIGALSPRELRRSRHRWQIVFQEPFASLNPRLTIGQIVEEPLIVAGSVRSRVARRERVARTLEEVGLSGDFLDRRPANLSGGQQQRVGIARALVTDPSIVVLDEPTASLDLTIRASILRMLNRLRESRDLTYVFISHDIETVRHFCSRVMVMHHGRFVESGPALQVLDNPQEEYTRGLMSAAMPPIPYRGRAHASEIQAGAS